MDEIERLKAIGAWMREVGASELSLGDLHIKLAPRAPAVVDTQRVNHEEVEELTAEEEEANTLKRLEAEHYRTWQRLTRSSGAPIPAFKPPAPRPA